MDNKVKKSVINKGLTNTLELIYIALSVALITVCTWISIPLVVPFTLQTFAIFTVVGIFDTKKSMISVAVYILLGIIGVPVFSGFSGSLAKIVSPTGGYIVGFIFMTLISSLLIEKTQHKPLPMIFSMLLGLLVLYIFGTAWYAILYGAETGATVITVLSTCVFPFIIPDILKILLAVVVSKRVRAIMKF